MVAAHCSLVGSRSLAVALGLFTQCAPYMLSDTRGYAVYWGSLCMVSEDGDGSHVGAALALSCHEMQRGGSWICLLAQALLRAFILRCLAHQAHTYLYSGDHQCSFLMTKER